MTTHMQSTAGKHPPPMGIRPTLEQASLLKQAADLQHQSLNDFILETACTAARQALQHPPLPLSDNQDITDASDDPLFGLWRERDDMADVDGYLRKLRAPRFG